MLNAPSRLSKHVRTEAETVRACVYLAVHYCRAMGIDVQDSADPMDTVRAVAGLLGHTPKGAK